MTLLVMRWRESRIVCLLDIDGVWLLEQTLHQLLVWVTEAFAETP